MSEVCVCPDVVISNKIKLFENDALIRYSCIIHGNGIIIEHKHETPTETKKTHIVETYDDYLKINKPYQKWVDEIETNEPYIYNDNKIIVAHDYKYSNDEKIHILVFFKDKILKSIRDLTNQHIELLQHAKNTVQKKFPEKELLYYFHYHPSVWQLHLHVISQGCWSESKSVERAVLLETVICNLEYDTDYYKKIKIPVFV